MNWIDLAIVAWVSFCVGVLITCYFCYEEPVPEPQFEPQPRRLVFYDSSAIEKPLFVPPNEQWIAVKPGKLSVHQRALVIEP